MKFCSQGKVNRYYYYEAKLRLPYRIKALSLVYQYHWRVAFAQTVQSIIHRFLLPVIAYSPLRTPLTLRPPFPPSFPPLRYAFMTVPGAKFRVESDPDARGDMQALRQKDSIVGKAVAQTLSAIATRGMLKRVTAVAQGAVNDIIANWETLGKQDKYAKLEPYFGTVAKRNKALEQTTSMFEKCTGAMFTTPYSGSVRNTNDAWNDTVFNDRGEGYFKRSNADVYENTGVEVRYGFVHTS